jgi:glycosyltransferase involved in cell wall biosynthesis
MRIGIETSVLRSNRAGSAVYTRHLVTHLRELCADHRLFLYAFGRGTTRTGARFERVIRDTVWMHAALPLKLWRDRIEVFHATAFNAPLLMPCPSVLTVLDLTVVKHPEWFDHRWFYHYTTRTLPVLASRADRIVTISECSKRDLMDHYGLPAEKIVIVPPAVDHRLFHATHHPESVRDAKARFGIDRKYVLSVGTLEPRKNLVRLVESFALLTAQADDCLLVVVGEKGWQYDEIFRTVRALGLEDTVRFLGFVPEAELPLLYGGAELFVYPSLYEGFGVPILEAMASGCPVVCSNRSSMPEVVGDAGLMVDPEDPEAIAQAMRQVLSDSTLAKTLRGRGLERAQHFRWDCSARMLLTVYEGVRRSARR